MSRGVVIGLDGAAWHLLEPMLEGGLMPRLARLRSDGAWGKLASTVPTYTPPAWTSAFTGVNPGRHGVYGFIAGHAQHQPPQLMHSGLVKAPAVWDMARTEGVRVGVYNVPITYPPREVDGWMVSGMMTPGYDQHRSGFASWDRGSEELERKILEWAPGYVLDLHANYETDWRDAELCMRALSSLKQRRSVLEHLLELDPPDLVFSVLETPDRLQHVYYRYMDPADEMHRTKEGAALRPAIEECFSAMDDIVGVLDDFAAGGGRLVCSDHGFTAWEVSVHTNALLESWGLLHLRPGARSMQTGAVRKLVPLAKKVLPRKLARDAKAKTFAAIDWSRTRAFASPIPQQGVFVNLRGREPHGIVDPGDLRSIQDELVERFTSLRGPDGDAVTDRVFLSEDVFRGEAVEGRPDVLPVLRDHRFELDDEVFHRDPFSDVRHMPRGVHHPAGIAIVAGAGIAPGERLDAHVWDVTPTLLYLAGLPIPEGLDGSVMRDAFDPLHLNDHPPVMTEAAQRSSGDEASPYTAEEEALIEESLRGLGYL